MGLAWNRQHKDIQVVRGREWRKVNKDRQKLYNSNRNQGLRTRVLTRLGEKCVQCGFSNPKALQIDHINGGGIKDRGTRGSLFYKRILMLSDNEFFSKYQCLCANCNTIKRIDNEEFRKGIP